MRRITKTTLLAAPAIALLAACSSGGTTTAAPTTTPSSAAPTTSLGASPSSPPSSDGGGQSGGESTGTSRCHTADLTITTDTEKGGGAAGSFGEYLVFTNRSRHTCTLYGYPGVSFVAGDKGTPVNLPFTRTDGKKSTIRLSSGGKAYALILLVEYQNYAGGCQPVQIRGYRVYPPDETAAVFVSAPQKACSVKNMGVGQVLPIAADEDD